MPAVSDLENVVGVGPMRLTENDVHMHGFSDLFGPEVAETALIGNRQGNYPSDINNTVHGPYTIEINGEGPDVCMEMASLRLHMRIKLQKFDKSSSEWVGVTLEDGCGVVNNLPSAMWRRIEVGLNHAPLSTINSPAYHHRSYLEKILNYNKDPLRLYCRVLCIIKTPLVPTSLSKMWYRTHQQM